MRENAPRGARGRAVPRLRGHDLALPRTTKPTQPRHSRSRIRRDAIRDRRQLFSRWRARADLRFFRQARIGGRPGFMEALRRMNRCVRKGVLLDRVFFCFDITDFDGAVLGVELGIKTGRPYVGVEAARVDISADDLAYLDAVCAQARYLAEGGRFGVASRIARTPRTGPRPSLARPIWENFGARFCNNGEKPWWID